MLIPHPRQEVPWSPAESAALQSFLSSQVGLKTLTALLAAGPSPSGAGPADRVLGRIEGYEQAVRTLCELASVEAAERLTAASKAVEGVSSVVARELDEA